MPTRRAFVSLPADEWLSDEQNALKWALVERVEESGVVAEIFVDPRGTDSLAGPYGWTAERADDVMRRCVGAVLIGLPRWTFPSSDGTVELPTEYCHYEGAIARTLQLPTLVLVMEGLLRRVVFDGSLGGYVGTIPRDADASWLHSSGFVSPFTFWQRRVADRRDVFLGYCSASEALAASVKRWLLDHDVTVLDWQIDFEPANSILHQIERAGSLCSAGVFLFTKDDEHAAASASRVQAPRDNVVFEAGYFISAKGKDRVLILREEGAKMPADLGGDIYGSFAESTDLSAITGTPARFIATM